MAKDKPKEQQAEPDMILEMRNLKRIFVFGATVVGFMAWQLFSANAQQDMMISEKVGNPQFTQLLAQVTASNDKQHASIVSAVQANTAKIEATNTKIDANTTKISAVDSKASEILGIVKTLMDAIREKDE